MPTDVTDEQSGDGAVRPYHGSVRTGRYLDQQFGSIRRWADRGAFARNLASCDGCQRDRAFSVYSFGYADHETAGPGRIINIGSISAQMPRMEAAPYATSKHAIVGLTKAAALEGRAHGVVVSCLHPGNVMTARRGTDDELPSAEPMMTPDELATVVLTMAVLPPHINMLESIVLPTTQLYLGRGETPPRSHNTDHNMNIRCGPFWFST